MAITYLWSGATGTASGANWANAKTTLDPVVVGPGDTVYVAHDHSELTAAGNPGFWSATIANPGKIICVNRLGTVPPVASDRRATAVIATSGDVGLALGGVNHWDGINFVAGNGSGNPYIRMGISVNAWVRFDNCSFRIGSTGSTAAIKVGYQHGSLTEWNNCTVSFSNVGQGIHTDGGVKFIWRNTPSALLGTIPTTLFRTSPYSMDAELIGVDLSAAGSGKTIFSAVSNSENCRYRLISCKLDAAVTKSAALVAFADPVELLRSGSGGVNYQCSSFKMTGTLTEETTIVRTGGASDGTTPIAWKVITTANCNYSMPFECPPIAIWNDTTGSAKTATVEGIWGGGAVPNDDDIWLDVEYPGDASSPQGSFVNDGKADLIVAAAAQTSSSATWGGSTTKFKLGVTFTAQQKGLIYARVKCAKASSTFYIDPLVTLT